MDDKISVKAVDRAGNERIVTLPTKKSIPWYKNYHYLAIIIIVGAIVVGIFSKMIYGGNKDKKNKT